MTGTVGAEHIHAIADASHWPWLKTGPGGAVLKHPYCDHCGQIMAIGSDRPYDRGGLTNLIARLSDHMDRDGRRIIEAQRRLIHRKLNELQAGDPFAWTLAAQVHIVCEVVGHYTGSTHGTVLSYVRDLIGHRGRPRRM